jgi:hypothetical protein
MGLDIRVPTGGMFTLLGLLLVGTGVLKGEQSMGININLYWGLVMLAFGATMLLFGWRASRK